MSAELDDLLITHISATVTLLVRELEHQGGVQEWQVYGAMERRLQRREANRDEAIMFKMPETAQSIHELCEELAVLAFMPGGVKFAGLSFVGKPEYVQESVDEDVSGRGSGASC